MVRRSLLGLFAFLLTFCHRMCLGGEISSCERHNGYKKSHHYKVLPAESVAHVLNYKRNVGLIKEFRTVTEKAIKASIAHTATRTAEMLELVNADVRSIAANKEWGVLEFLHNNLYQLHKPDNHVLSEDEKRKFEPLLSCREAWVHDAGRYKDAELISDLLKGAHPTDIPKGHFWDQLSECNMSKNEKRRRKRQKMDLLQWGAGPKKTDHCDEIRRQVAEFEQEGKALGVFTREELSTALGEGNEPKAITPVFILDQSTSDRIKLRLISDDRAKNTFADPREKIAIEDARSHTEMILLLLAPEEFSSDEWSSSFQSAKQLRKSIDGYREQIKRVSEYPGHALELPELDDWRNLGSKFRTVARPGRSKRPLGISAGVIDLVGFYFEWHVSSLAYNIMCFFDDRPEEMVWKYVPFKACQFGTLSSVYHALRISRFLQEAARYFGHVVVSAFYDDFSIFEFDNTIQSGMRFLSSLFESSGVLSHPLGSRKATWGKRMKLLGVSYDFRASAGEGGWVLVDLPEDKREKILKLCERLKDARTAHKKIAHKMFAPLLGLMMFLLSTARLHPASTATSASIDGMDSAAVAHWPNSS